MYTPGNEAAVSRALKIDLSLRWIVRYAHEEALLKKYIAELDQPLTMNRALAYAQQVLPPNPQPAYPQPMVDYILYDYDASGSNQGIVMDLLVSYDLDQHKPGIFLGHEIVHYALAYSRIKTCHFKYVPSEYQAVFSAINGISEEGIADLVDKPYLLFDKQSPYLLKDTLMYLYTTQSTVYIQKINEAFEQLADLSHESCTTFACWKALMPVSGHIPGTFMGQVIERNGLKDKLTKRIHNPFTFFYLYNEAAHKDPGNPPPFSQKAISFIKKMERRHFR